MFYVTNYVDKYLTGNGNGFVNVFFVQALP